MKTLLFLLVSFVAVSAFVSGLLMISNPDGSSFNLSVSILKGTPFKDFLIPGILLAFIVGGINLLVVFFNLQRHRLRYLWAMIGGWVISCWIVAQMILIGTFHWLHIFYLIIGILIILISFQLKGKWAV